MDNEKYKDTQSGKVLIPMTVIAVLIFGLVTPIAAQSAIFMQLEGENQGNIEGSCTEDMHVGWIDVYDFDHVISFPQSSDTSIRHSLTIKKACDRSTVRLYEALCTGGPHTIVVDFITPSDLCYFTIKLEDARIDSISHSMSDTGTYSMEDVSFSYGRYGRISWTWAGVDPATGSPAGKIEFGWDLKQ